MRRLLLLGLIFQLACGDDTASDGGQDAAASDAAASDAAASDAAASDAAEPDAPIADSGSEDAFDFDAPVDLDAALADAPPLDAPVDDRPSSARHTAQPLGTTDAGNGYWEYLPPAYGAAPSPLLVFWHGLGENGDGSLDTLDAVNRNGPPRLVRDDNWPNERPFVVLSPQHAGGGCPNANEIRDFIAFAIENYEIDPARVYLTGLSCGAIGSWNYLGQEIDSTPVAAAVLIAGDGRRAFRNRGCDLAVLPIWGLHGDADGTVDVAGTRIPLDGLLMCPEPRAEQVLTIYEGVGHNSWARTYDLSAGNDIYTWMLTQSRD
ncbi:MAG: putative esterase [Polyangiales bacterium]|jgi:predicted esterase